MPIAGVELVMMASAAVLAAQHFPRKVDNWEGLPAVSQTWTAWKKAFRLAHLKRQRQILASGGGGASWRCAQSSPGNDADGRAPQNGTQQSRARGNKRFHGPLAAHDCQLGLHGHHHVTHSDQQKTGGCGKSPRRDNSGGGSGGDSSWRRRGL